MDDIKLYFDENNLKVIPAKRNKKYIIFDYIANTFFDENVSYTESEVNEILKNIYPDFALIRRYLVDFKLINRTRDCKIYWKEKR
jgi:hypothetical protein